jgi:hypothetical protein
MSEPSPPTPPAKNNKAVRVVIALAIGGVLLFACCGLGVVGILYGVQSTREKAQRLHCTNNLHQLGIAFHNYHLQYKAFPTEASPPASFYLSLLPYMDQGTNQVNEALAYGASGDPMKCTPIPQYICAGRRRTIALGPKRDYGYAATSGTGSAGKSVLDAPKPVSLTQIIDGRGTSNTLLLSHVWMDPKYYAGGDPTDLGWISLNNSRSINDTAKLDSDTTGSIKHIGGPHPTVLPSLFSDGRVDDLPYKHPAWSSLWAFDSPQ